MSEDTASTPSPDKQTTDSSIADALKRAKDELEKAQAFYDHLREQATERLKTVRRTSIGDVLDGTLEMTKRHPGAGLTIAALLGFYLGRLFRR